MHGRADNSMLQNGAAMQQLCWYDSTTGNWITQDPLGFAAGDNKYFTLNARCCERMSRRSEMGRWNVFLPPFTNEGKS